jgi:Flp pilus assembly protein TadD
MRNSLYFMQCSISSGRALRKLLRHAKRCGLGLAVCASLLAGPRSYAQLPRTEVSDGTAASDQAYREIAATNYLAAIEDFRRALATDQSNVRWRTDLGFAYLAADELQTAATEFKQVYAEHPEAFGVALQLGYLSQQVHRDDDAKKYFEAVARDAPAALSAQATKALVELRSTQLHDRKQHGYELLAENRNREALTIFEGIHDDDPSDSAVTLQIAYLYASGGRTSKAKLMFAEAGKDADTEIARQANAGLEQLDRDSKFWFASFYAAPFCQSRFSNEISPANAKIGLNLSRYFQPYVGLRFSRDIRSKAGTLPESYSDNSAVLSIGVQSALWHTGAVLYADAGTAVNLIGEKPLVASDYRVGIDWFRSWGATLVHTGDASHSISLTGSAYVDGGFYSRYNHNFIGNVQVRGGINLPTTWVLPMQLLAATNLVRDTNGNFYNNVIEFGPALRISPLRHVPSLSFEAQYLRGFYIANDPTNPYGARYSDCRLFLIWSKTF